LEIGVLELDLNYYLEWGSILFAIPKENGSATIRVVTDFRKLNLFLKCKISPISNSKVWGQDPFNGRVYLCFSIGLEYGILSHKTRC
jgi:hypothetical protein